MGVIDISAAWQAPSPMFCPGMVIRPRPGPRYHQKDIHLKNQMATFEQRYIQKDNSIPKPLMSFQHCENWHANTLTGLQVPAHIWARLLIGQLLATVPLRGINLRSKVAVFWKALLVLYMTTLSVRYLSHTPVSKSHLKNESKWYLCTSSLSIHSHLVDHAAHGDLA